MSLRLAARARSARSALSSSGTQHVAAEIDALRHFAGQARRHQQRRLVVHDVEDRGAVGARLLAHRIDAAKSFGHQQAGAHALAFEQRIGADRGAVAEIADVGRRHAACEQGLDARQDRARGIVGRRRHFGDRDLAGFLVEIDEIRERPSGIDRDAVTGHAMTRIQTRDRSARYKDMLDYRRQRGVGIGQRRFRRA